MIAFDFEQPFPPLLVFFTNQPRADHIFPPFSFRYTKVSFSIP